MHVISWICGLLLFAFASARAQACLPLPPPTPPQREALESAEAYQTRMASWQKRQDSVRAFRTGEVAGYRYGFESGLWETAPQIALVQIVSKEEFERTNDIQLTIESLRIKVQVLRVVRGKRGSTTSLTFTESVPMWCASQGATDILRGEVGDKFVLFFRSGPMSSGSVIESYGARSARDGRTTTLLDIPWKPTEPPEQL